MKRAAREGRLEESGNGAAVLKRAAKESRLEESKGEPA